MMKLEKLLVVLLLMTCSMQAVCSVCCLILTGHFIVNLMKALIMKHIFIFQQAELPLFSHEDIKT